jgi:ketosteroid isomerase-like protein
MDEKKAWFSLAVLSAGLMLATGCGSPPLDLKAEIAAVTAVIERNVVWFKDKDFDLLFGTYTPGPDLFMFQLDTASTIRGFEEFKKYSVGWRNPDVGYGGHKFHELNVHLSQAGDAAWFEAILEDCSKRTDGPVRCFTTRVTGVLEKRADRWLLVQQHFSLPAEKIAEDWAVRSVHPPSEAIGTAPDGGKSGTGRSER